MNLVFAHLYYLCIVARDTEKMMNYGEYIGLKTWGVRALMPNVAALVQSLYTTVAKNGHNSKKHPLRSHLNMAKA